MEDQSKTQKDDHGSRSARWTVCACNNCPGNLEFESARAGETVKCPHCGVDTVLFVAPVPVDSPSSAPQAAPNLPPTQRGQGITQTTEGIKTISTNKLLVSLNCLAAGILLVALLVLRQSHRLTEPCCSYTVAIESSVPGSLHYTLTGESECYGREVVAILP